MRLAFCIALIASLPTLLVADSLSSADYQAGIREATEQYRGDGNEADIVIFTDYYVTRGAHSGLAPFSLKPFTLYDTSRREPAETASVRLDNVRPNLTLQLTTDAWWSERADWDPVIRACCENWAMFGRFDDLRRCFLAAAHVGEHKANVTAMLGPGQRITVSDTIWNPPREAYSVHPGRQNRGSLRRRVLGWCRSRRVLLLDRT